MKHESPFDATVMDEELDPYAFRHEQEAFDIAMLEANAGKQNASLYALCVAQSLDDATEAYESLTMASQSDPVPCLGYISSGMASLSWILENAELEELAAIAEDVNQSMSDLLRIVDRIKGKREVDDILRDSFNQGGF